MQSSSSLSFLLSDVTFVFCTVKCEWCWYLFQLINKILGRNWQVITEAVSLWDSGLGVWESYPRFCDFSSWYLCEFLDNVYWHGSRGFSYDNVQFELHVLLVLQCLRDDAFNYCQRLLMPCGTVRWSARHFNGLLLAGEFLYSWATFASALLTYMTVNTVCRRFVENFWLQKG